MATSDRSSDFTRWVPSVGESDASDGSQARPRDIPDKGITSIDRRPPTWCTADEQRAAADLEQMKVRQRECTKEELKEYISEKKNASDSSSMRPSSGGERHNAAQAAATLDPRVGAPGAPGERVNPLVQYFDLKAQDANLDARNAAAARTPDAQHSWPTWAVAEREAKLKDTATEKAKAKKDEDSRKEAEQIAWDAGFTERLAHVTLEQEETRSEADSQAPSTLWDHVGNKVTFGRSDGNDGRPHEPHLPEGSQPKQTDDDTFDYSGWLNEYNPSEGASSSSAAKPAAAPAQQKPSSQPTASRQKQTANVGGNDHVSITSGSTDKCADAPWRRPHSSVQPPAPNATPEENEQTPWYAAPTPVICAGALAPPAPSARPDLEPPPGASQKPNPGGAYTRPMPPAPSRSPAAWRI